MIAVEKPNTVKSSGIQTSVSFGIKQEGLAHIFNVLRNQLYSDKILAVIREYSCNAVDANVEAGCPNEPITVSLPNRLEPTFKVRDNGLGLSDKDIQEIYAFYGESTKRNSNALIGQLGLGSKSAFAYGDNYVINSFVDGVKTSYNAFIDASQIGQISKLCSMATTEPNGVEIVIPVKDADINAFKEKAQDLFEHFRVRPTIKGQTLSYPTKDIILSGSFWSIERNDSYYNNSPVAVMGNIGYKVETSSITMESCDYDKKLSNYNLSGLVVQFNIGDLEVSASRESLQYTERTQKALLAKMQAVMGEIVAQLSKKVEDCSTYLEAKKLYGNLYEYQGTYYRFSSFLKGKVSYKGTVIDNSQVVFGKDSYTAMVGVDAKHCKKSRTGSGVIVKKVVASTNVSDRSVFVLNDEPKRTNINARVYDLVFTDKKSVNIISFSDNNIKAEWMKREGFVDADFTKLSSLIPTTVTLTQSGTAATTNATKSKKHGEQVFTFSLTASNNYYQSTSSKYWDSAAVDLKNDSGVYLEIDAFKYNSRNTSYTACNEHPSYLKAVLKDFEKIGVTIPTIHGFKKDTVAKVAKNKNWQTLWSYLGEAVTKHLVATKTAQAFADKKAHIEADDSGDCHLIKAIALKDVDENGAFGVAKAAYEACGSQLKSKENLVNGIKTLERNAVVATLPAPTFDLKTLVAKMVETYPMLSIVYSSLPDKEQREKIIDYIALVDKS